MDMAVRASMNVSVTPELEAFVQRLVASGRYHSASEVFRDGLRLLELAERRRLLEKWLTEGLTADEEAVLPGDVLDKARAQLQEKTQEGLDALDRGEGVDGAAFFERWRARLAAPGAGTPRAQSSAKRRT